MDASTAALRHRLWLRLFFAKGVGGATFAKWLDAFKSVEAVFEADQETLENCAKQPGAYLAIHDPRLDVMVDRLHREHSVWPDARILTPACESYPRRLLTASAFPAALFVRGTLENHLPSVAVVGSRKPKGDRAAVTREWCRQMVEAGASIVSGMATGIDAAAHEGALQAPGHTVAVLGTGLAKTYPWRHAALQDRILASGGAVVSQFAPHAPSHRGFFAARNATIAGMADALVVIQAGKNSGALITAKDAKRFGRPVLAVPSHPADKDYEGCLQLLKNTAHAISSPEDVLKVVGLKGRKRRVPTRPLLSPELQQMLEALDYQGMALDELTRALALPAPTVLDRLLRLELAGEVARQPGPRYVRLR